MAIRKAFIDWKRLEKSSGLESGKEYLVFAPDKESMSGVPFFAVYYEQGDVVKLPLRDDYRADDKEPTNETRLLAAIFGRMRDYIVPMDGLYEQTGDYGVDEKSENGAFEGCSQQLVLVGNTLPDGAEGAVPVFWAECPVLPAGYALMASRTDAKCIDREYASDLRAALESDPDALYAYQGLCGTKSAPMPGDDERAEIRVKGAFCDESPERVASLVLSVAGAAKKLAAIPDSDLQAFDKEFHDAGGHEAAARCWNRFREARGITLKEGTYALKYLAWRADEAAGFYKCRDRILARGGSGALDSAKVVIEAYGMSQFPPRIARLVKLMSIGAPAVILQNELRMACEFAAAWRLAGSVSRVTPDFAECFGINPDGTRSGSCSEVGDAELMHEWLQSQDCGHDCEHCDVMYCDERDGEIPELAPEDDGEEEPAEVPRYGIAYMPNFMMRQKGAVILDSLEHRFVRDGDGNIEVWTTCPKERLEQLNAAADAP